MATTTREPAGAAKGKPDDLEYYQLIRDYIEHEDGLINNRVGWFIQLHSFLIASYGIVFAAIVGTFIYEKIPVVSPLGPQIVACALLVGIGCIGIVSSRSAYESIKAAHRAINQLATRWQQECDDRKLGDTFPYVIGGGDEEINKSGADFHLNLPVALITVWWLSFLVPIAFFVMAQRADSNRAASAEPKPGAAATMTTAPSAPPAKR